MSHPAESSVSRVTDALRRAIGDTAIPATAPAQTAFEPAWRVAAVDDEQRRSRPPALARTGATNKAPHGLGAFAAAWGERLATGPAGNPALIEQFRRLAGVVHQAQQTSHLRSVMVTSATAGEGKTLTAVNLALVLAESYRCQVLLVDADLRNPSIPDVLGRGHHPGLGEALQAPTDQPLAPLAITSRLMLLPAGRALTNSLEALTSPRMRQILDEAEERFDCVILDAPPVGPTADAHLLTKMAGGTVFVVHAGRTPYASVTKALDAVGRDQLLGLVLNGVDPSLLDSSYYRAAQTGAAV